MSNNSLLTKHRPSRFKDIIGQDEIVRSYKRALEEDLVHAFLFTGPSGCGKTTLARLGAKVLGIPKSNITEIDAATHNGVEDMRKLTEIFDYRPLRGQLKALIIDECHVLSKAAWQPLLKKIEEPPEWVFWFFCTTEIAKVPTTIKTRCVNYNLKSVGVNDLVDFLARIVEKENFSTDRDILQLCAREANGSPRQALAYLSACFDAQDRQEAARVLLNEMKEGEGAGAYGLAKALVEGQGWKKIQPLLKGLESENPESIRHVVRAYITSVALNGKSEEDVFRAASILDQWIEPFEQSNQFSSVVIAVARSLISLRTGVE